MTNGLPGSELTKEPFRWDQRLFSIVLKLPAVQTVPDAPTDASTTAANSFIPSAEGCGVDNMCDVTGGKCSTLSNTSSSGSRSCVLIVI